MPIMSARFLSSENVEYHKWWNENIIKKMFMMVFSRFHVLDSGWLSPGISIIYNGINTRVTRY